MRLKFRRIQFRVAKDNIFERFDGLAIGAGWNTAIDKSLMVCIFIRQIQCCFWAQFEPRRRIDTDLIAIVEIAMIFESVIHRVNSERAGVANLEIAIDLQAIRAERVDAGLIARKRFTNLRLFGHPVEDAAGAATTE